MTDTCKECRFMEYCKEFGYVLDCDNLEECNHYESYIEGLETAYIMDE